jgi:hypothetical protein
MTDSRGERRVLRVAAGVTALAAADAALALLLPLQVHLLFSPWVLAASTGTWAAFWASRRWRHGAWSGALIGVANAATMMILTALAAALRLETLMGKCLRPSDPPDAWKGSALIAVVLFLRRFERALRRSPVLGMGDVFEPAEALDEILADALAEVLPEEERRSPDAAVRSLRVDLADGPAAAPGTLAKHEGLRRRCARWYLGRVAKDGAFFDEAHASAEDRAVIARELPEGSGPRVVVCGHTHAARHVDLGDGRVYLNCGTWMDLMKLPPLEDDTAQRAFINALEAGNVPRLRLRTYVEVTEHGAALRHWPPAAGG